jgi:hypothetical protein
MPKPLNGMNLLMIMNKEVYNYKEWDQELMKEMLDKNY